MHSSTVWSRADILMCKDRTPFYVIYGFDVATDERWSVGGRCGVNSVEGVIYLGKMFYTLLFIPL